MWGFAIGMLLGALASFFLWDRNLNYRNKAGMLCGMCIKLYLDNSGESIRHKEATAAPKDSTPTTGAV
jgi:hypothetical protein